MRAGVAVDGAVMRERVDGMIRMAQDAPDNHKEYLHEFEKGNYWPELLFSRWPEVLERARINPAAQWKLKNLRKIRK